MAGTELRCDWPEEASRLIRDTAARVHTDAESDHLRRPTCLLLASFYRNVGQNQVSSWVLSHSDPLIQGNYWSWNSLELQYFHLTLQNQEVTVCWCTNSSCSFLKKLVGLIRPTGCPPCGGFLSPLSQQEPLRRGAWHAGPCCLSHLLASCPPGIWTMTSSWTLSLSTICQSTLLNC